MAAAAAARKSAEQVYIPQPAQSAWHACGAYESGFGGAKFGGKSYALLFDVVRDIGHPAYRGILFRREYPRLTDLIDLSHRWYPGLGGSWRGDEHRWTFPSGAAILFRHCSTEEDKYNYHGHSYHYMGFDQLEEFTESQYTFLLASNRTGTADLVPITRSTFNPGGIGHTWVKGRFIDRGSRTCPPWQPFTDDGRPLASRCFHFATMEDNPAGVLADVDYRQRLLALTDAEQRAYIYGDWDVFAGQMFGTWRRHIHVVDPFVIPPEWPRWGGLDYGYSAPSCYLWFARDPVPDPVTGKRRMYTYREFYGSGFTVEEQGQRILRMMAPEERVRATFADPSLWNRTQAHRGHGLALVEYYPLRLKLVQANNDRIAGVQRVQQLLRWTPDEPPEWQVFSSCTNLIRTLPGLVRDAIRVEDVNCFTADTMIATPHGTRAIWTLRVGDLVQTPIGARRVLRAGISGHAPVMSVRLADGRWLTGTPDHQVFVRGSGLIPLSAVTPNDILMERNILGVMAWATRNRSIETCERLRGIFLHTRTSIIRTMTRQTMLLKTFFSCQPVNMPPYIFESVMPMPLTTPPCTGGHGQKPGELSSGRMPARCEPAPLKGNARAEIVELLLRLDIPGRCSALHAASTLVVSRTWRQRFVGFVAGSFGRLMMRSSPARIVAVGSIDGREPVYNLTVEEAHLYFANGVLVTNTDGEDHCYDSARYAIMGASREPPAGDRMRIPLAVNAEPGRQRWGEREAEQMRRRMIEPALNGHRTGR